MNWIKKNGIITARKLCNIFRFTGNLQSVIDDGEFETSYSSICSKELKLVKKILENLSMIVGNLKLVTVTYVPKN